MSGAWLLIVLIVIMIMFIFTVQAIAKRRDQPILTSKDIMEALKQNEENENT